MHKKVKTVIRKYLAVIAYCILNAQPGLAQDVYYMLGDLKPKGAFALPESKKLGDALASTSASPQAGSGVTVSRFTVKYHWTWPQDESVIQKFELAKGDVVFYKRRETGIDVTGDVTRRGNLKLLENDTIGTVLSRTINQDVDTEQYSCVLYRPDADGRYTATNIDKLTTEAKSLPVRIADILVVNAKKPESTEK